MHLPLKLRREPRLPLNTFRAAVFSFSLPLPGGFMEESSRHTQDKIPVMMELKRATLRPSELMTRNQPKVLSMLVHFVGSRQQARPRKKVFLNVYQNRETYQPTAKFSTWLYRIVRLALNAIRSKGDRNCFSAAPLKERVVSGTFLPSGYIPTRHYDKEEREMVHLALQSLNERQRESSCFAISEA